MRKPKRNRNPNLNQQRERRNVNRERGKPWEQLNGNVNEEQQATT
jgi:hypothetical protein